MLIWVFLNGAAALQLRIAPDFQPEGLYLGVARSSDHVTAVVCDKHLDVVHRCECRDEELQEALGRTARHIVASKGDFTLEEKQGPVSFMESAADSDEALGLGLVETEAFLNFGDEDTFLTRDTFKVIYKNGDVARSKLYRNFDDAVIRAPPGNVIGIDVVVPEQHPRCSRLGRYHAQIRERLTVAEAENINYDLDYGARLLRDSDDPEPRYARAHIETRLLSMRGSCCDVLDQVYVGPEVSRSRAKLIADVFGTSVARLADDVLRDAVPRGRAYRAAADHQQHDASFSEFLVATGKAAVASSDVIFRRRHDRSLYHDDVVTQVLAFERIIEDRFRVEDDDEEPSQQHPQEEEDPPSPSVAERLLFLPSDPSFSPKRAVLLEEEEDGHDR